MLSAVRALAVNIVNSPGGITSVVPAIVAGTRSVLPLFNITVEMDVIACVPDELVTAVPTGTIVPTVPEKVKFTLFIVLPLLSSPML